MASSKPEWLNKIRTILIHNLDQLDLIVAHLGTSEFNATAKWGQLTDQKIETRFFRFMDAWYEQTNCPSVTQIISALQDMKRNDIIDMIRDDVRIKEKENGKQSEDKHKSKNMESPVAAFGELPDSLSENELVKKMVDMKLKSLSDISENNEEINKKIKQYENYMDFELKFEYHDAMVLFHDDDKNEVKRFRERIEQNVVLNDNQAPKIALYPRIALNYRGKFNALEFGIERCTFVLLFITAKYMEDALNIYSGEICLIDGIENGKWCVVPVYTDDAPSKKPLAFKGLKEIYYSPADDDFDAFKNLFNDRISVRKREAKRQRQKQIRWIMEWEAREQVSEMSENERRSQIYKHEISVAQKNDQLTQQSKKVSKHLPNSGIDGGRDIRTSVHQDIVTDNPASLSTSDLTTDRGSSSGDVAGGIGTPVDQDVVDGVDEKKDEGKTSSIVAGEGDSHKKRCIEETLKEMSIESDPRQIINTYIKKYMRGRPLNLTDESSVAEGQTFDIFINRENLLLDAFSEVGHRSNEDGSFPLMVTFIGEDAQDCSGPRREFLSNFLCQFSERFVKDGCLVSEEDIGNEAFLNYQKLNSFESAGLLVGISVLQGGPIPAIFKDPNQLFFHPSSPIEIQFTKGLDRLGLIQLSAERKKVLDLFNTRYQKQPLTYAKLVNFLKPTFSEKGSNQRMGEDKVYRFFLDYLKDVEAHRREGITLQNILKFVTGSVEIPVLGDMYNPTISFQENKDGIPRSNTCLCKLSLPNSPKGTKEKCFESFDYAFCNEYFGNV